jgi:hypothetical protein
MLQAKVIKIDVARSSRMETTSFVRFQGGLGGKGHHIARGTRRRLVVQPLVVDEATGQAVVQDQIASVPGVEVRVVRAERLARHVIGPEVVDAVIDEDDVEAVASEIPVL